MSADRRRRRQPRRPKRRLRKLKTSTRRTMDVAIKWNVDVYTSASYLYLSNNYYICAAFRASLFFCLLSSSALYFVHILDAVLHFRLSGDKFLLFSPLLIYIMRFDVMIKFAFSSFPCIRSSQSLR